MKNLIRRIRGWLYRRSRQAQTDRIEAAMYDCTQAIVWATELAVDCGDTTKEQDAHLYLRSIRDDALKNCGRLRRNQFERIGGWNA